jgi:hypothetical protein
MARHELVPYRVDARVHSMQAANFESVLDRSRPESQIPQLLSPHDPMLALGQLGHSGVVGSKPSP